METLSGRSTPSRLFQSSKLMAEKNYIGRLTMGNSTQTIEKKSSLIRKIEFTVLNYILTKNCFCSCEYFSFKCYF